MQLRLFLVFILSSLLNLNSQIVYVSSSTGFSRSKEFLSIQDYIILVGDKKLQNYELREYTQASPYRMNFSLNLGVNLFKKKVKFQKFHPTFHVGYTFIPAALKAEFIQDKIITSYTSNSSDPSTSFQYGLIKRDNATAHLAYFQMFIENGVLFKLRPAKRISFDYGALFLLGNTKMKGSYIFHEIDSLNYKKFEIDGSSFYEKELFASGYENPDHYPIEVSNISLGLTFPFGIDFRLGKNPQKFGRYHFLFAFKPSFVFKYLNDVKKIKYSYISNFTLLSFKFDIIKKENNEK